MKLTFFYLCVETLRKLVDFEKVLEAPTVSFGGRGRGQCGHRCHVTPCTFGTLVRMCTVVSTQIRRGRHEAIGVCSVGRCSHEQGIVCRLTEAV